MSTTSSFSGKKVLVVVAHTDDEVIFFGSMISTLAVSNTVRVVCMSSDRPSRFWKACRKLGAADSTTYEARYSGRDKNEYVPEDRETVLANLHSEYAQFNPELIVSHGPGGEYKNVYHMMVCDVVRNFSQGANVSCWSRIPGAPIVFPEAFEMKSKLLDAYGIPAPQNWNKFMHQREMYESSLP